MWCQAPDARVSGVLEQRAQLWVQGDLETQERTRNPGSCQTCSSSAGVPGELPHTCGGVKNSVKRLLQLCSPNKALQLSQNSVSCSLTEGLLSHLKEEMHLRQAHVECDVRAQAGGIRFSGLCKKKLRLARSPACRLAGAGLLSQPGEAKG